MKAALPTTVRMGLISRKPTWTADDFQRYWRDSHGALASRAPNLKAYWQNVVTEKMQRGIAYERGPWNFDGFSQLWFESARSGHQAFNNGDLGAQLIADENHFLGGLHIVSATQHVIVPVPDEPVRSQLLKRMSTLRRRSDISEEDFQREWRVHGDFVRTVPGVAGYRQNVIVDRELVKGTASTYAEFPIDGIVELWFETPAALEAAFASKEGRHTMDHAKTFLSEITAFLVQERKIL